MSSKRTPRSTIGEDHRRALQSVECIRPMVCEKLKAMDCFIDENLPDYILTMVANRRSEENMVKDLSLFMGSLAEVFVDWLAGVVRDKVAIRKDEPPAKKASGESQHSRANVGKEKRQTVPTKTTAQQQTPGAGVKRQDTPVKTADTNVKRVSEAVTPSKPAPKSSRDVESQVAKPTSAAHTTERPRRASGLRLLALAVAGANADTAKALPQRPTSVGEASSSPVASSTTSAQPERSRHQQAGVTKAARHGGRASLSASTNESELSAVPSADQKSPGPQFFVTLVGSVKSDDSEMYINSRQRTSSVPRGANLTVKRSFASIDDEASGMMPPRKRRQQRCVDWPQCLAGNHCEFVHPHTPCRSFPNCRFGNECLFLHPDCKHGRSCWQEKCPFVHREGRDEFQ